VPGVKSGVHDDGRVNSFASGGDSAKQALKISGDIAAVAEVEKTYMGHLRRLGLPRPVGSIPGMAGPARRSSEMA
jgi:polyribonucleotide nucleotidyltransferase